MVVIKQGTKSARSSDAWCAWFEALRRRLGGRYEALLAELDPEGEVARATPAFFDRRLPKHREWASQMGYGHGINAAGAGRNTPNLGFYLEPLSFSDCHEGTPDGNRGRVEVAVRLVSRGTRATYNERMEQVAQAVRDAFEGAGISVSIDAYPNTDPRVLVESPFTVSIARVVGRFWEDPTGAWLSMCAPATIEVADRVPSASDTDAIANHFEQRWDEFCGVVHFVRGYLASTGKSFSPDRKALLGFAGEYVTWTRLHTAGVRQVAWLGRWSNFDLRVDEAKYEVKCAVGAPPTSPFFTVGEIACALDTATRGETYTVVAVGIDADAFEELARAISGAAHKLYSPTSNELGDASAWISRLCGDVAVPYDRIRKRLRKIREALANIAARAEHRDIDNPFSRAPLAEFARVRSRIVEGSVRISISS